MPAQPQFGNQQARKIVQDLEIVQDRFFRLALAFDEARYNNYAFFPPADWMYRADTVKRDQMYATLASIYGSKLRTPQLFDQTNHERICLPFDTLALYPFVGGGMTSESLSLLRGGILQSDPFTSSCLFGYLSHSTLDYWLISVGPDRRSDIFDFVEGVNGRYYTDTSCTKEITDMREVERKGLGLLMESGRSNHGIPRVNINQVYDPTNGLFSAGDIVFHRYGSDNWMFHLKRDGPLYEDNRLSKKDLSQQFTPGHHDRKLGDVHLK